MPLTFSSESMSTVEIEVRFCREIGEGTCLTLAGRDVVYSQLEYGAVEGLVKVRKMFAVEKCGYSECREERK